MDPCQRRKVLSESFELRGPGRGRPQIISAGPGFACASFRRPTAAGPKQRLLHSRRYSAFENNFALVFVISNTFVTGNHRKRFDLFQLGMNKTVAMQCKHSEEPNAHVVDSVEGGSCGPGFLRALTEKGENGKSPAATTLLQY